MEIGHGGTQEAKTEGLWCFKASLGCIASSRSAREGKEGRRRGLAGHSPVPGPGFYAGGKGLLPSATHVPSGLGLALHIPWIATGDG